MGIDIEFRRRAVKSLTASVGVYVLCDLDEVPIYVGKSSDGIRKRVGRHLTSARSDVIANRQIDVWEIAYVWAYPTPKSRLAATEALLFHHFHRRSPLMNGTIPGRPRMKKIPRLAQRVQVMSDDELAEKKDPALRLPRQASHYSQLVGHFVAVKNSEQVANAMKAHFARLGKYHRRLLREARQSAKDDDGEG